ncbi:hypothetical protein SFC79_09735 [Nocardioides sp. S-58]|uniref:Uncharacterized protein n=1 Tax=Nocardioides renjunii TaxID=3095075 RepID=A0ABU5KAS7_9ACTN|nr:hypothetical protein [Nocardioides sp. S-58]MDZ5662041.1 hypothetical protein [Nocardioides sp. S-58]
MPTLTAWCYRTPFGARRGELRLRRLQDAEALEVHCAIVVTWVHGAHRPRTAHVHHRVRTELDDPVTLTALARVVLEVATSDAPPAAADAAAGRLRGTGVDSEFLVATARHFVPGCSVLLVMSGRADLDVVRSLVQRGLAAGEVELVRTELAADGVRQMAALLDAPDA